MSRNDPPILSRRQLRSTTASETRNTVKTSPYYGVQQRLDHERSLSPGHRSIAQEKEEAETDDEETLESEGQSTSFRTQNSSYNQSYSSQGSSPSPQKSPKPIQQERLVNTAAPVTKPKDPQSNIGLIIVCIVGLLAIVLVLWSNRSLPTPASLKKECTGFFEISKKYPTYEQDIFLSLKFGVEDLLNKNPCRPSVFLYVHDVHKNQIRAFIETVVANIQKCLDTDSPLLLSSKDFKSSEITEDYGYALTKYKVQLAQSSVMVVYDVADVPAAAAQAFHTICDTINPLVNKAIILLTLQVSQNQINATDNANEIAEERLMEQWANLANDKLSPLIARVTDQVFLIKA